jgi:hypothetical protein
VNADDWLRKKLRVRRRTGCLALPVGLGLFAVTVALVIWG